MAVLLWWILIAGYLTGLADKGELTVKWEHSNVGLTTSYLPTKGIAQACIK